MIIRLNPAALGMLAGSFVACALVMGLPYWSLSYSQVDLPAALLGWGLVLAFVLAAAIQITGRAGFLATAATLAATAPFVVMVRVACDTALDPTSHNLWPFEFVIAAVIGGFVAMAGTMAGSLLRVALNRSGETRQD